MWKSKYYRFDSDTHTVCGLANRPGRTNRSPEGIGVKISPFLRVSTLAAASNGPAKIPRVCRVRSLLYCNTAASNDTVGRSCVAPGIVSFSPPPDFFPSFHRVASSIFLFGKNPMPNCPGVVAVCRTQWGRARAWRIEIRPTLAAAAAAAEWAVAPFGNERRTRYAYNTIQ